MKYGVGDIVYFKPYRSKKAVVEGVVYKVEIRSHTKDQDYWVYYRNNVNNGRWCYGEELIPVTVMSNAIYGE